MRPPEHPADTALLGWVASIMGWGLRGQCGVWERCPQLVGVTRPAQPRDGTVLFIEQTKIGYPCPITSTGHSHSGNCISSLLREPPHPSHEAWRDHPTQSSRRALISQCPLDLPSIPLQTSTLVLRAMRCLLEDERSGEGGAWMRTPLPLNSGI